MEKSVPVCQLLQWPPRPPQLSRLLPGKPGGTGYTTEPVAADAAVIWSHAGASWHRCRGHRCGAPPETLGQARGERYPLLVEAAVGVGGTLHDGCGVGDADALPAWDLHQVLEEGRGRVLDVADLGGSSPAL